MQISLIRHGESLANTGDLNPHIDMGDAYIPLSSFGVEQSKQIGVLLGSSAFDGSIVYCSPYTRARMTLSHMLDGANLTADQVTIYEDPRLREEERGYKEPNQQFELRKTHGWFYYRHKGGESSADCYNRVSNFIESMFREQYRSKKKKIIIVTHGMIIRVFVMRFFHLTVEQFENIENPDNTDVIQIAPAGFLDNPGYSNEKWEVSGIRNR